MTWYLIATNLHSDFYGVSVLSQMHIGTSLYVWCSRSLLTIHKMFRMIMEVHLWLDKYIAKSIKDSERKRLGVGDLLCVSTGLEHTTFRQSGQKLLSNELVRFFDMCQWGKERPWLCYVRECYQYVSMSQMIRNISGRASRHISKATMKKLTPWWHSIWWTSQPYM